MTRRIPSSGTPTDVMDLVSGLGGLFSGSRLTEAFERELSKACASQYVLTTGSGAMALYVALEAFKRARPGRTKVVLPAYSAPSIVLPVRRAGLVPVLCEVSAETFNMDLEALSRLLSEDVLCVVPTHLFGIPTDMRVVNELVQGRECFVLEDAAQSMGATIDGKPVGSLGDIGIISFNRGKNFSTYTGGALLTADRSLAGACRDLEAMLSRAVPLRGLAVWVKLLLLSQFIKPGLYGLLHPLAGPLKSTTLPADFERLTYTGVQAGVAMRLMSRLEAFISLRRRNGMSLLNGLRGVPGVQIPAFTNGIEPAFNQFPLVVSDQARRDRIIASILKQAVETTRLYLKPIHKYYDLGYAEDAFPIASRLADGLVLIPTHPYVTERDIERICKAVRTGAQ